jgi:hypothetical protein
VSLDRCTEPGIGEGRQNNQPVSIFDEGKVKNYGKSNCDRRRVNRDLAASKPMGI